jgi:uncharacterized membrane protein
MRSAASPAFHDLLGLWVCAGACLALLFLVDIPAVRLLLSLPLLFAFPGYAVVAALCAGGAELGLLDRAILAVGLSLAVTPVAGLLVLWRGGTLDRVSTLFGAGAVMAGGTLVAAIRRTRAGASGVTARTPAGEARVTWPAAMGPAARIAVATLLLGLGLWAALSAQTRRTEAYTEFYVRPPAGRALDGFPLPVTRPAPGEVVVGVANREGRPMRYAVHVRLDGEVVVKLVGIALDPEQTWERRVRVPLPRPPGLVRAILQLYTTETGAPYREATVWFDVRAPERGGGVR